MCRWSYSFVVRPCTSSRHRATLSKTERTKSTNMNIETKIFSTFATVQHQFAVRHGIRREDRSKSDRLHGCCVIAYSQFHGSSCQVATSMFSLREYLADVEIHSKKSVVNASAVLKHHQGQESSTLPSHWVPHDPHHQFRTKQELQGCSSSSRWSRHGTSSAGGWAFLQALIR